MADRRYTLGAGERLKRGQHIEALFRSGKALSFFPVRIVWRVIPREGDELFPVRAGFSAPKKKFRRAPDRARIKRLLREAWRLQKHGLSEYIPAEQQLQLFLLYNGNELPDYETVFCSITKGIAKLQKALSQPHA